MNLLNDLKYQYKVGGIAIRLIFLNVILFIAPEIIFAFSKLLSIDVNYIEYVSLSSNYSDLLTKPWSILTYAFFHKDFFHLAANMIMLFYVGRLFLTFFTQKQLLSVYVLGGIFSGIVFIAGYTFLPALSLVNTSMVGASGAIMAILFAITSYQPQMDVNFLGLLKLRLWHIAFAIVIIDMIQLPMNNTGGHIAHIAGALFGFIYIKVLQNGIDLGSGMNTVLDWFANLFSPKKTTPFKKVHRNPKSPSTKTTSKIVTKDKTQQQIDEILEKISQSGYDSLTADEKEFLFKAGKQ